MIKRHSQVRAFRKLPLLVALAVSLGIGGLASAQHELSRDVLFGKLFPPDLVLRHATEIGLSEDQRKEILNAMREAKRLLDEGEQKLREATRKLGSTLDGASIDEQQMIKQLDDVLRAERAIKRGRLTMLAKVKNQLSAEQQEKLQGYLRQTFADAQSSRQPGTSLEQSHTKNDAQLRDELNAGIQKVKAGVEQWRKEGRDTQPIMETMKNFSSLMHSGKLQEAKQLIDEAQRKLESPQIETAR